MQKPSKIVLITGASSGLGAGMAREFAARGYSLALCARRTERLLELADELTRTFSVRVEVEALDVNDHPEVFRVFRHFAERFGGLDRIVVNAGVGEGKGVMGTTLLLAEAGETFMLSNTPIWVRQVAVGLSVAQQEVNP